MSLMDEEDDLQGHSNHRELTLSTGTVLGIFLGLALSWALFFGFGYNMGAKSRPAPSATTDNNSTETDTSANFKNFKPSPASTAGTYPTPVPQSNEVPAINTPPHGPPPADPTTPPDPTAVAEKPSAAPIHLAPATPTAAASTPGPLGTFNVQVAAFSHPEDATMLVTALRKKGYAIAAVQNPTDNLTHVQIGPFNNRKEAESMRQQLLSDGYNAMIK